MQFHHKTAYVWGLCYRWDPLLSMNPVRRFAHFMPPCYQAKRGSAHAFFIGSMLKNGPPSFIMKLWSWPCHPQCVRCLCCSPLPSARATEEMVNGQNVNGQNVNGQWSLGCPSQTCFFKNQWVQPILMVFGGWLEGSQKDFWFGQVLGGAQGRQKSD